MRIPTCKKCHRVLASYDERAQVFGIAMHCEPAVEHMKRHGIKIDGFGELKKAVKVIKI